MECLTQKLRGKAQLVNTKHLIQNVLLHSHLIQVNQQFKDYEQSNEYPGKLHNFFQNSL